MGSVIPGAGGGKVGERGKVACSVQALCQCGVFRSLFRSSSMTESLEQARGKVMAVFPRYGHCWGKYSKWKSKLSAQEKISWLGWFQNCVYYRTNFTEVVSLFSVICGHIFYVKIDMHRIY